MRKNNPVSPDWEWALVQNIHKKADFLSHSDFSFLKSLQSHRHLCAHPALDNYDTLYSPNKETARAHIRNILEGILCKTPIMSGNIFDIFCEDIEQFSSLNPNTEELTKYLSSKYFRFFSPRTFGHIFKKLWRITFKSTDSRCEENRSVNTCVLMVLLQQRKDELLTLIENEGDWFSDISLNEGSMSSFTHFLRYYPSIFPLLTDGAKVPIVNFSNKGVNELASCWFIDDNPLDHMNKVLSLIKPFSVLDRTEFANIVKSLSTTDAYKTFLLTGIKCYTCSTSFNDADLNFGVMVEPYISEYERVHFVSLLEGCENCHNNQATGRGRSAADHLLIKNEIDLRYNTIDLSKYPAFCESLGTNDA